MSKLKKFIQAHVTPFWRTYVVVLTPLLLLPMTVHGAVNIKF